MKLGAAKHEAGRAAHLIELNIPKADTAITSFRFQLNRHKLKQVRRREGRYLLRTNLGAHDPVQLWTFYVQLTEVEQAFKELKHDLALRPIYHPKNLSWRCANQTEIRQAEGFVELGGITRWVSRN